MKKPKTPSPEPRKAKSGKPLKAARSDSVDPLFAPIVRAFAARSDVSPKKMFSSKSVLSVDGRIFAMLVRGKFVAKLPKARVDALVTGGKGEYFDPGHGRLMKEWVAMASSNSSWLGLAQEAYAFVKGLAR